jgi:rhodanese-related sulfurtransferase
MAPQPRKGDDGSKPSAKEGKTKSGGAAAAARKAAATSPTTTTNSGNHNAAGTASAAAVVSQTQAQTSSDTMVLDLDPLVPPPGSKSIDNVLTAARSHLHRLDPQFAFYILSMARTPETPPAVLVDIRPFHQRQEEGVIPGALLIERNVLEWRFDPRSTARLDIANRYDLRVIVFCSEGYTSSLAAKALQELGLWNATDINGGFKAWKGAGLPAVPQDVQ